MAYNETFDHASARLAAGQIGALKAAQNAKQPPLMELSAEEAHKAVAELDAQVSELLARIAPVCQPSGALTSGSVGAKESPETTPSPMRVEFMKLRNRVQEISARIASVRYTIEL